MSKSIAQILEFANNQQIEENVIEVLRQNDTVPLRTVLQYAYHPEIQWLLPEGAVPYTPSQLPGLEPMLFHEVRRFYLFVSAGGVVGMPELTDMKRQQIFVDVLESLDARDAALLVAVKDKTLPYEKITPEVVDKAFPGMLGNFQSGKGKKKKS